MKMTQNGISTTQNGQEQFETFHHNRKNFVQYDYRTPDGELFSTCKPSLEECRQAKENWLKQTIATRDKTA
jgi:hypothetical protein